MEEVAMIQSDEHLRSAMVASSGSWTYGLTGPVVNGGPDSTGFSSAIPSKLSLVDTSDQEAIDDRRRCEWCRVSVEISTTYIVLSTGISQRPCLAHDRPTGFSTCQDNNILQSLTTTLKS
jgi:hypothetical protein